MSGFNLKFWLVLISCLQLSTLVRGVTNDNSSLFTDVFPQLINLFKDPHSRLGLRLGGQNMTHCCLLAVNQSLEVDNQGFLLGLTQNSFIAGDLETFSSQQFPCGATYNGTIPTEAAENQVQMKHQVSLHTHRRQSWCTVSQYPVELVYGQLPWMADFQGFEAKSMGQPICRLSGTSCGLLPRDSATKETPRPRKVIRRGTQRDNFQLPDAFHCPCGCHTCHHRYHCLAHDHFCAFRSDFAQRNL